MYADAICQIPSEGRKAKPDHGIGNLPDAAVSGNCLIGRVKRSPDAS
jgi:hypothetical protein